MGKPLCGAARRHGQGPCKRGAGAGTDHPGIGRCSWHGGCAPSGRAAARAAATADLARKAVETFGLPRDITPGEALLEEVRCSAGHVAWLREKIRELDPGALVWGTREVVDRQATEYPGTDTTEAAAVNVWLDLYYRERRHLADVAKAALAAGIEERKVRLAERQGELVAQVVDGILTDLGLTAAQQKLVPEIVPRRLRALTA